MEEQDFLSGLPSDVTEPIYNYCSTRDLINLACCSKSLRKSVKYLLWQCITLPWRHLQKQPIPTKQLKNLKYTATLSISYKHHFFDGCISWKSVVANFENVFYFCNPYILSAIYVDCVINDSGIQLMLKLLETAENNDSNTYSRERSSSMRSVLHSFANQLPTMPHSRSICDDIGTSHHHLKELHLCHCSSITDQSLKLIGGLTGLKQLSISHNQTIPPTGFHNIAKLFRLMALNLESTLIDNDFLFHMSASLPDLRRLIISHCDHVDDAGLLQVYNLKNLESLDVSWCTRITDRGFVGMENVPLVCLKVQGCTLITDHAMKIFAGGRIQELNIGCTNISDVGLSYLVESSSLQHLTANGCYQISDSGLSVLKGMSCLNEVDLSGRTGITDNGLAHISHLTSLQRLKIQNCPQLTDLGLYYIGSLKSLVELDISGCTNVTDVGIMHLHKLEKLKQLHINRCQVTERGLSHLRVLKSLKLLSITKTPSKNRNPWR